MIAGSVLTAPAAAQDEDDEESDPRLRRAMESYLAELAAMTPPEVVQDTTVPGIQGGGTEMRLVVPGTEILVREDGDDPGDMPTPPVYGEEICPSVNVRGQFEPTQAVWQDDPTFADKPGKRIVRLSPVLWRAELPMVTNRRTLLFGIERAPGAEPRRHEIFLAGEASGTPVPVKLRFTLKQPGRTEVIHETGILAEIPIGGPCGPHAVQSWEVPLDVPEGVPYPPDNAFRFDDGEYLLEAELVRENGSGTGLKVGVLGQSVLTHSPALAFRVVGILGSTFEPDRLARLEQRTVELAEKSARVLPDFLPVASEPLVTKAFPTSDRRDLLERHNPRPGRRVRIAEIVERLGAEGLESYLNDSILADFLREMEVGGLMSGYDRVVVMAATGDFNLLYSGQLRVEDLPIGGFAGTQKVVVLPGERSPEVPTVAHEVIHTFPFSFADEEMLAECDRNYHNKEDAVAHGHQVTHETRVSSLPRDGSSAIMGPAETDAWITQCTYRHVLEYLSRGAPDPRVLLVQGYVGREAERTAGMFLPFYDLDGVEDLPSGGTGGWAIVLRDERGDVLSRHAWEPAWRIPHIPRERRIVSFAFRVLRPEGLARVELEGPAGIADSVLLSATDPVVSIVSPAEGAAVTVEDRSVTVEWRGSDADGDDLLYTVLYSSDGGRRWIDAAVEVEGQSLRVPIDLAAPADAHRILVRATDGTRSADAVVAFRPAE